MKAIHLKCERVDGNLKNLSYDRSTKLFSSGQWDISVADAKALCGGWLYLHAEKSSRSEFGGIIEGYKEVTDATLARQRRIVFFVRRKPDGDGQKWRGRSHLMAHSSGVINVDFPHEASAER